MMPMRSATIPLARTACDRLPDDARGLSSQPTLSRLEHAVTARDVVSLQRQLEADYVAMLATETGGRRARHGRDG